jgi:hypothetical protein
MPPLTNAPVQARAQLNGTSPTVADLNNHLPSPTMTAQLTNLHNELASLQHAYNALSNSHSSCLSLLSTHETLLDTHILPQLRRYAHTHALAITSLHSHYQKLLEDERKANLELRLDGLKWQEGLGRVSEWARLALRETAADEGRTRERLRLGKLKEENRVLRQLAGWPEKESDSEEEGDEEDDGRGRDSAEP